MLILKELSTFLGWARAYVLSTEFAVQKNEWMMAANILYKSYIVVLSV
jgi:hypothetical protein